MKHTSISMFILLACNTTFPERRVIVTPDLPLPKKQRSAVTVQDNDNTRIIRFFLEGLHDGGTHHLQDVYDSRDNFVRTEFLSTRLRNNRANS